MKPTNLRSQLLILGAQTRLQDLNRERDELLKILNVKESITVKEYGILKELNKVKGDKITKIRKKYKRKGLHWTQKPENKAKMMKNMKAMIKIHYGR